MKQHTHRTTGQTEQQQQYSTYLTVVVDGDDDALLNGCCCCRQLQFYLYSNEMRDTQELKYMIMTGEVWHKVTALLSSFIIRPCHIHHPPSSPPPFKVFQTRLLTRNLHLTQSLEMMKRRKHKYNYLRHMLTYLLMNALISTASQRVDARLFVYQ